MYSQFMMHGQKNIKLFFYTDFERGCSYTPTARSKECHMSGKQRI